MSNPSSTPAVPHHVAIVMDGNGRWAARRFLPRLAGLDEARSEIATDGAGAENQDSQGSATHIVWVGFS